MQIHGIADSLIAEAVARNGGYEEIDQTDKWGEVAAALGKKKSHAPAFKARYEDLLSSSVEQDELEDDDMKEEEVEQILDKRTHQGQPEYRGTVKVAVLVGPRPATTGSSGCT